MRFAAFENGDQEGRAIASADGVLHGLIDGEESYPGNLALLVQHGDVCKAEIERIGTLRNKVENE
jgi:hypothetical protein